MKKTIYAAIGFALLCSSVLTGCSSNVITVASEELVMDTKAATVHGGYLNNGKVYTGTIIPNEEVTIVPKVGGRVATVDVEVGMEVYEGQTLFTIEDQDLKNASVQANAAVDAAKSGLNATKVSYESGILAAKNAVDQAENNVTTLENSLEEIKSSDNKASQALKDAQNNYNRTKQLFDSGAASQVEVEQAETTLINAKAAVNSVQVTKKSTEDKLKTARIALNNARKQLELAISNPQVAVSAEQIKQAEAAAKIAKDTLAEATVESPINGVIGKVNISKGEMVSSQSPAIVIADLSKAKVEVYLSAEEISMIKAGDKTQVNVPSLDLSEPGIVNSVSPLDENGKGHAVEIRVDNPEQTLKSGMIGEVTFLDSEQMEGLIVPSSAVTEIDNKHYVYIIESNQVFLQEVTIGERTESQVLITGGLQLNEKIASTNVELLEDGMNVRVEN